tara:strand:+ start:2391 stop:3437 length:1047 start_codon:yes stop_codon:yes gene_type:complete
MVNIKNYMNYNLKNNNPVDIVYTWVNSEDENWLTKKNDTLKKYKNIKLKKEISEKSRFQNRDELKYSLRSVEKFAKWIRNIYIVTDNQKPDWLNCNHPKINIINHADIFKKINLPLFNSNAIGSRLHHIKGLSDDFLYLNDDVFLGRTTTKNDFFYSDEKPKIFVGDKLKLNKNLLKKESMPNDNIHQRAILNSRRLIFNKFNIIVPYTLRHGVICYNKLNNFEVESLFLKELNKMLQNQFRDNSDLVFSTLVAYYLIATNKSEPIKIKPYRKDYWKYKFNIFRKNRDFLFIPLYMHKKKIIERFNIIKKYKPLMFCVNDGLNTIEANSLIAIKELDNIFPKKSEFEK